MYSCKKNGKYYAGYHHYFDEIAEDCQKRCIYCDITLEEDGFEGMQLDHFRPRKHYSTLVNVPSNLVLSRSHCNRLKSDHWPAQASEHCHNGRIGFVDPFEEERCTVFCVDDSGQVIALKGPAEYIIKLLILNRPSRLLVRRRRIELAFKQKLSERISRLLENLWSQIESNSISREDIIDRLRTLKELQRNLSQIL